MPSQLYEYPELTSKLPVAKVESILKALDINYMKPYYAMDPESKSINLQNLRDDATVRHINSKFFTNNPLDLSRL